MLTIACPKCKQLMQLDEDSSGWCRCESCKTKLRLAEDIPPPPAPVVKAPPKPAPPKSCKKCGVVLRKTASHCHVCGAKSRSRIPIAAILATAAVLIIIGAGIAIVLLARQASVLKAQASTLRAQVNKSLKDRDNAMGFAKVLKAEVAAAEKDLVETQVAHDSQLQQLASEIDDYKTQAQGARARLKPVAPALTPADVAADCTRVIESADANIEQLAKALYLRGLVRRCLSQNDQAAADWTRVIEMKNAPAMQVALALIGRGGVGEGQRCIDDFTRVIEMKGIPAAQVIDALIKRGAAYSFAAGPTQPSKAIADFTQVIEMKDVPAADLALALTGRAELYSRQGSIASAIGDYTQLLEMKDVPAHIKSNALECREKLTMARGNFDQANPAPTRLLSLDEKIKVYLEMKDRHEGAAANQ